VNLIGAIVAITGAAMLAPMSIAAIYGEWSDAWMMLLTSLTTMALGLIGRRTFRHSEDVSMVQAFGAVGLAWFVMAAFGALPYLVTGSLPTVTDAFFESASGFTATGSSVAVDLTSLSHGILFWRALTQWLGGMGVIVLAVTLLPLIGVGAVQLATAEAPGPIPERLTPRFKETARRIWLVYAAFTVIQVVLLTVGEMNLFEAATHSLTTISGGGFGTRADSIGAFSAYSQWIVIVFMVIGGTSFALHYRGLRNPIQYLQNTEFRLYMSILALFSAAVVIGTWGSSAHTTIRDAVFTVSSILTTTGFATADFGEWQPALQLVILGLMFVGAMAGSTSGSVKVFRLEVLLSDSRAYLHRLLHPRGIFAIRSGRSPVTDDLARSVRVFAMLYLFAFMTGTVLLGMIGSLAGMRIDIVSSASAVAASLGNVGPGLEMVGPTHSFSTIPGLGKWLLSTLMIVGRLEVLPVMLLFTREFWRH